MEVYNVLGSGYLEGVYQEALAREFIDNGIPHEREAELTIYYKGSPLEKKYRADFVCYGKIIVELKAVSFLSNEHLAQVKSYLKTTNHQLGLLVNFGNAEKLEWLRRVNLAAKTCGDGDGDSGGSIPRPPSDTRI